MSRILIGIFSVALTLFAVSCESVTDQPLTVGFESHLASQPFWLALETDFHVEYPVDLIEFPASIDTLKAFHNGLVDVALVSASDAILTHYHIPETRIVQVAGFSYGADGIVARSAVDRLEKLRGKTLAVNKDGDDAYLMHRALETANIGTMEVSTVTMNHVTPETLEKTHYDAYVVHEPLLSRLSSDGWNVLFTSNNIPNEIVFLMIAREEVLCEKSQQLDMLKSVWFKGLSRLKWEQESAVRAVAASRGLTYVQMLEAMKRLDFPNVAMNNELLSPANSMLLNALNDVSQNLKEYGVAKPEMESGSELLAVSVCQ